MWQGLAAGYIHGGGNGEPCPQDAIRGAQVSQLWPEEQGWQPPRLRRASWNRASLFPIAGGTRKQGHAWEDLQP